jgi:ATP-dependent Lhr-like helicase
VDPLAAFLPSVGRWFRNTFDAPTSPQFLAWPAIARRESVLLVAPTGSGKTLAAFLAALDHLWRTPRTEPGVRILYISPLKALNVDVARNLERPLDGILRASALDADSGPPLSPLTIGVRTGDTTPAERQKQIRNPPDILITTPESLHLLLTSRARESLRNLTHLIIDEIHALAPNKRGTFLALLLERLEAIRPPSAPPIQRIGLSATQRPLETVAAFLGGRSIQPNGAFSPRPVTLLDAGRRKDLDLQVILPGPSDRPPGAVASVWPAIEARLVDLIRSHRSTIVFANNRRVAERLTSHLNEALAVELDPGDDEPIQSHHGSLSLERRRSTEERLKAGELKAVVATASLELGIDMGAVELVCQVESPGSVSRGLQRVGRAGHVVGQSSRGRLLAKTPGDLLESAALARAMRDGDIEALHVPTNALDILAQQIVACVAVDSWSVPDLFNLVRCTYPYRDLTADAFESVLELVSGRFALESFRDLRPRISWDRIHNRLNRLPGTSRLALTGGGSIPDTGQFPVHLGDDGPRLGELDEEFVFERRVGESFILGASTWTIQSIEPHRVIVAPAAGQEALTPFWRGESAHRSPELGQAVGRLSRELADRAQNDPEAARAWLVAQYDLDEPSAASLVRHILRQVRAAGAGPDDRTILVESFRDPAGETSLAVLTPFGGKLHRGLELVLRASLRRRLGIDLATLHNDDGILCRLPGCDDPPLDVFRDLAPETAEAHLRAELGDSALFGLRFRQNAGRALLLPRPDPGKRTPLWLQRLRARDLLQAVRQMPDFPIVVETYRECLTDDLDLPRLRTLLSEIQNGSIRIVTRSAEHPSPFTSELVFAFVGKYLYEWDDPKRTDRPDRSHEASPERLDPLLAPDTAPWIDPRAVGQVDARLRGVGRPPRTVEEMADWLRRLGDLAPSDLDGPMLGFLQTLNSEGRSLQIDLPKTAETYRWISTEDEPLYRAAFHATQPDESARARILARYVQTRALVGLSDLVARYPVDPIDASDWLEAYAASGAGVRLEGDDEIRFANRQNLSDVRRLSLAMLRNEAVAVRPEILADSVLRWQYAHPETSLEGPAAISEVLDRLRGFAAPPDLWESEILPRRISVLRPGLLDSAIGPGGSTWQARDAEGGRRVAIVPRDLVTTLLTLPNDAAPLSASSVKVRETLKQRGALYADELATAAGLDPLATRRALDELTGNGLVTNDRFDPLRPGGRAVTTALEEASQRASSGARRLGRLRAPATARGEGRWSLLPTTEDVNPDARLEAWAAALLDRYGVLCRETAALDPWAPAWRELYPVLVRAELRGELRRGYLVEGLTGLQYAWPDTVAELSRLASAPQSDAPLVVLSSLDPANLYGSGAPLDVPLLEGGTARLVRNAATYLVLRSGRPILIIESHGRRLTGLASASEAELTAAIALLPTLTSPARRVLKVETYNLAPALASPAAPWLSAAGFVRDYPGMTFYAGW